MQCARVQEASPVCIIHGPFGCGKSSLLVAIIHYVLTQRSQASSALKGCRILVSAHTNVAVDRLMTGLLDTGCTGVVQSKSRSLTYAIRGRQALNDLSSSLTPPAKNDKQPLYSMLHD